ncbi:TPA: hypothetical protein DF272_06790 [Candidatus Falkowbacteria bacterium]|nr:hypothetical protein [Candidatus Falkowbacteria bacterium]
MSLREYLESVDENNIVLFGLDINTQKDLVAAKNKAAKLLSRLDPKDIDLDFDKTGSFYWYDGDGPSGKDSWLILMLIPFSPVTDSVTLLAVIEVKKGPVNPVTRDASWDVMQVAFCLVDLELDRQNIPYISDDEILAETNYESDDQGRLQLVSSSVKRHDVYDLTGYTNFYSEFDKVV